MKLTLALFFAPFAAVFAKLLELGLDRGPDGRVRHAGDGDGYRPAPKKSDDATAAAQPAGPEADPLSRENAQFRQRKDGAKL